MPPDTVKAHSVVFTAASPTIVSNTDETVEITEMVLMEIWELSLERT